MLLFYSYQPHKNEDNQDDALFQDDQDNQVDQNYQIYQDDQEDEDN